jgi:3-phosphoglycerate kinase
MDPEKVERPLLAIVGGAKISDKILVIENLIEKSDGIIACGGMAYTFLKVRQSAQAHDIDYPSLFPRNGALGGLETSR